MADKKTIEDILIDGNYKKIEPKKKNPLIVFLIVLLIVLLLGGAGVYGWNYYMSLQDTSKDYFGKYFFNNNMSSILKNDVYKKTYEKIGKNSFKSDTSVNFTNNFVFDGYEGLNLSNLIINNSIIRNKSLSKVSSEINLNYSDNDVFGFRTISTNDGIAFTSDQVVKKFISSDEDEVNNILNSITGRSLNFNIAYDVINTLENSSEVDVDEEDVSLMKKEMVKLLTSYDDSKYSEKDIIIENNGDNISTKEYKLVLTKDEADSLFSKIMSQLENSKIENHIITGQENKSIFTMGKKSGSNSLYDAFLQNAYDTSGIIAGEDELMDNALSNNINTEAQVMIERAEGDNSNLTRREVGSPDETTIGSEPVQNNDQQPHEQVVHITDEQPISDVETSNQNTVNNEVTSNTTNQTSNEVTNSTNTTNITNTTNTTNSTNTSTPTPIIISKNNLMKVSGVKNSFSSEIQVIDNPNLTSDEDKRIQEEQETQVQEDTMEIFNSISDTIQNTVENARNIDTSSISNRVNTLDKDKKVNYLVEFCKFAIFNQKMNLSSKEFHQVIDEIVNRFEGFDCEEYSISIYVEKDSVKRIIVENDKSMKIEVDFITINSSENKLKVAFLNDKEENNGFSLEIYKNQKDVSSNYNIVYGLVKSGSITEKTEVSFGLEGTENTNELKNEIKIKYSSRKGEFQALVNNVIKYEEDSIEQIAEDKVIYLNNLLPEEKAAITQAVKDKFTTVLSTKLLELNIISESKKNELMQDVVVVEPQITISRDDARDLVVKQIQQLMSIAVASGQEFAAIDIINMQIEGHTVTTENDESGVTITIDGYVFHLSNEFELTDVEV